MSETNSSVLSGKKVASSVAAYIWNSPCLKPLVFNPFIVSILILTIIWLIDFAYGKTFRKRRKGASIAAITIQHILTTYVIVASGIAMNNMIIKHRYRLDKCGKQNVSDIDEAPALDESPLLASYE